MIKLHKLDSATDRPVLFGLAIGLVFLAVFGRLLPHPPNFAAVGAVALFGGAILPRRWALSVPLVAMIASDLVIGLHPLIVVTWGSFALIALLSDRYMKKFGAARLVGASLGASLLFYLVSNFGVWLQGKMYAMNLAGLLDCYYKAIPFFRNTVVSDLMFTGLLFGMYAIGALAASHQTTAEV